LWSGASNLWNAIKSIVRDALNAGKEEAQTGSPSRLFADELGKWIPAGVAVGIEDNMEPVNKAMADMVSISNAGMDKALQTGSVNTQQADRIDYNRLADVISGRPIVIQGDTSKIFKVVRNQNKIITRSTNWNALGAATT